MLYRFCALLTLVVCVWSATPSVSRQSVAMAAEEEASDEGSGGGAAAAKSEEGSGGGGSFLMWIIWSSGIIGAFLLILSIYFVATVVKCFMTLTKEVAAPPDVVTKCEELLQARNFQGVYDLVKQDDSFFSRLVTVGIAEIPNGLADAREVMHKVAEAETVEMEKKISMLAVLGTLGPMIGLVGTLKGMITSFSVIAMSGTSLKPAEVAGGISEALLLTFEGVALSVPSIFFFAVFRNKVSTISAYVMLQSDEVMRHFAQAMRGGKTAPAPAGDKGAAAKTKPAATTKEA
jgi:biopolymer transport protein ExbB